MEIIKGKILIDGQEEPISLLFKELSSGFVTLDDFCDDNDVDIDIMRGELNKLIKLFNNPKFVEDIKKYLSTNE